MRTFFLKLATLGVTSLLIGLPLRAEARITRLEIVRVESPALGGQSFGAVGEYELIVARAYGELDPRDPQNAVIQDLDLAPRNSRGMVEYSTDVEILKPKDLSRGSGVLFYDVVNRGNRIGMRGLTLGSDGSFGPGGAGDGFLQRRGYTIVWSGWQGDLLPGAGRLTLTVPVAVNRDGSPITGVVRAEYDIPPAATTAVMTAAPGTRAISASGFSTSSDNYETASLDNAGATLTKRRLEADARVAVPRDRWAFADCAARPFPGEPDRTKVCLKDGFEPGYLYELVYTARNPRVLGIGFAATRDLISFLRHAARDGSGTVNPLANGIQTAMALGISQSGNYLRTFLHLGFNRDDDGKIVFDAMNTHVAARHLAMNIRFGQPGRGAGQRVDHLYPGSDGSLGWPDAFDEIGKRRGGILNRCESTKTCPKIFHTLSASEYWHLRASPATTDALGSRDLPVPDNVRIYLLSGTQHGAAAQPSRGMGQTLSNPNPHRETHRALLVALEDWTRRGVAPPPSQYPTIREGTLVRSDPKSIGWPAIPGITYSGLLNSLPLLDFGPGFKPGDVSGIISQEPPRVGGREYAVLVPKVDADGNEIAGIRNTNIQAPTGTYTGWSLRSADGELSSLTGSYIPFANTRAERAASGDPRLSIEERYPNRAAYVAAVRAAAQRLVAARFLLADDAERLVREAEALDR